MARREPEDFLRLLEARTGIVIESGEIRHDGRPTPVYEFRHLTFQEYLAGLALVSGHFPDADRSRSLAERVAPLAARITTPEGGEAGMAESWREPLRLCLTACNDADADGALLAILTPAAGEDAAVTSRARAVQAARCLADEPNVTQAVADRVLRAFVRHIDDPKDSDDRGETALDTAAHELAGSDLWIRPLERQLCAEFEARKPAARAGVGRIHGFVSDALRPGDDAQAVEWIRARVAALGSPDDTRVIGAALHVRRAAERHSRIILRVPDAGVVLMRTFDRSGPVTHAAAWALADLDQYSTGWRPTTLDLRRLCACLAQPETDHGAMATIASILGRWRFMSALPTLNAMLEHAEVGVRQQAALALGQCGDYRVAPTLLKLLGDADAIVRRGAVDALGKVGDERAVEPLLKLLGDADAGVRQQAANALGKVGNRRAVEPLLERLGDPDAAIRSAAAAAVGRLASAQDLGRLLERLTHPESLVRSGAANALGALGDDRAMAPLLARLDDADAEVRTAVAAAVGRLGDRRSVEPLLQRLDDDEAGVRRAVAAALGSLGDRRAVAPLLARLDDIVLYVRLAVVNAFGELGDERAVAPLLGCLQSGGRGLREEAARALGHIGDPRGLAELHHLLRSTVRGIRVTALEGLSHACEDKVDRQLLSRDIDGLRPFLDCRSPISRRQLQRGVRALGLSEQEIRFRYERLAERFFLRLAWR